MHFFLVTQIRSRGSLDLVEEENLDHADARCLRLAADLRRVLPGLEGNNHRRFLGIARLQTSSLYFRFLGRLPIVIFFHDDTVLVSQLKSRVRQCVGDPKCAQGRSDGKNYRSHPAILNDEAGDH